MRMHCYVFLLGTVACASRPATTTTPVRYACADQTLTRDGDTLVLHGDVKATPVWNDDDGYHFLMFRPSDGRQRRIEIVASSDARKDAVRNVYDTAMGSSPADWRLVTRDVCVVEGGDSDVLTRYARGQSLDELARDLNLGTRREARDRIRKALVALQRRMWNEQ